jgi:predicted Zn-dependent protease with MMP-like domain
MSTVSDDDALDAILDRLDDLDARDDDTALRAELARGLARFPEAAALREWQASLAIEDERFEEAAAILDGLLAEDEGNDWARRERAGVLIELGRFEAALADLRAFPRWFRRRLDAAERASIHFDLGLCLDRLGRTADADREFRQAARLDPGRYPMPPRLTAERFEALVAEALGAIPRRFHPYLEQVVVTVQDYPAADDPDPFLLGLYVGVPRHERTLASSDHLDHVVVFKRAHELLGLDPRALRDEVRRTVVHELAHHFGLGHDEMGEYR